MNLKNNLNELYSALNKSLLSLKDAELNINLEDKISKRFFQRFFGASNIKSKSNSNTIDFDKLIALLNDIYVMDDQKIILDENLIVSLVTVYKYLTDEEQKILNKHFNEAINGNKENLIEKFNDKCNEFFDLLSKYDLSNKFVYKSNEVVGTYLGVFSKLKNIILENILDFNIDNYIKEKIVLEQEIEELKKIYVEEDKLKKVVNSITECVSNLKISDSIDFSKSVIFLEEVKNKKIVLLEEKISILEDKTNIEKIEKAIHELIVDEVDMDFYYDLAYKLFKTKMSSDRDYDEIVKLEFEMMEYSNKHNFGNIEKIDASLIALERYSNEMKENNSVVLNKNIGLDIYRDLIYKLYKAKNNIPVDVAKVNKIELKIKNCIAKYELSNIELIESNFVALERINYYLSNKITNKNKGISIYEKLISSLYKLKKDEYSSIDEINEIERKIKKCSIDYKLSNIDKINSQFKVLQSDLI